MNKPEITSFFDSTTCTVSYIVRDPDSDHCAIIDSILDFDPASGRTSTQSADILLEFIEERALKVDWIIDTHVHADHVTAAHYLKRKTGGRTAIGEHISSVQTEFGRVFNEGQDFFTDGRQFDHLFSDNEIYQVGDLKARAIHTPGHTRVCMSHLVGDAVFVGDTLFMPDFGSARCDFPGGDAGELFDSIQILYAMPDETRMMLCHDYKAPGRDEFVWETTVGEQKRNNIHINENTQRDAFIEVRQRRDKTLSMPRLLLPSVQINMRAGSLPAPETNGIRYVKVPINAL